jgi:hypothetical protein
MSNKLIETEGREVSQSDFDKAVERCKDRSLHRVLLRWKAIAELSHCSRRRTTREPSEMKMKLRKGAAGTARHFQNAR